MPFTEGSYHVDLLTLPHDESVTLEGLIRALSALEAAARRGRNGTPDSALPVPGDQESLAYG